MSVGLRLLPDDKSPDPVPHHEESNSVSDRCTDDVPVESDRGSESESQRLAYAFANDVTFKIANRKSKHDALNVAVGIADVVAEPEPDRQAEHEPNHEPNHEPERLAYAFAQRESDNFAQQPNGGAERQPKPVAQQRDAGAEREPKSVAEHVSVVKPVSEPVSEPVSFAERSDVGPKRQSNEQSHAEPERLAYAFANDVAFKIANRKSEHDALDVAYEEPHTLSDV